MKNYPSKFNKLYESSDRFHDWGVREVRCRSNEYINRKKSDTVILSLYDDILPWNGDPDNFKETNWEIEFNNIKSFRFDCYAVERHDTWKISDFRTNEFRIGRIYSSEIGITDNDDFYFKFITECGHVIEIVFQNVKLTKSYSE